MKPSELLREKGWCQGALALDPEGHTIQPGHPLAVAHCMVGAYWACYHESLMAEGLQTAARHKLAAHLGIQPEYLTAWNDRAGRTKEEVIAALEAVGE